MSSQPAPDRFRPRARLLQLLGDQLIGSPRLAIFELVKNAYDADADSAVVTMSGLHDPETAYIQVDDDGFGMSVDTLRNIWLVPGHDHKSQDRVAGQRTARGRLPLGEKGVGRFAVHKLGSVVEVVTRQVGGRELVMNIDWDQVAASEYLDEAEVEIVEREPLVFPGRSGTRVVVTRLRGTRWTRGEVRRLARQITSISSPFARAKSDFEATLVLPDQASWLANLPDTKTLIDSAPWTFTFELTDNRLKWTYEFRGIDGVSLDPRVATGDEDGVLLDPNDLPEVDLEAAKKAGRVGRALRSSLTHQAGIGPLAGVLHVYDRDKEVLEFLGHSASLQEFLNESGGVRVYRDGIRVYNYGEPGDDWLGLDIRRINSPTKRISNNIVVGSVDLDLQLSSGLAEKTNREGFVDGPALSRLRALMRGIIAIFEAERNKDKQQLRKLLARRRDGLDGAIEKPLRQIEKLVRGSSVATEIQPLVRRAQKAYDDMREIMLRAGISGMSLVIVYHEIDHGVRLLHSALREGASPDTVLEQARDLVGVLDSFGDLIRRGESTVQDVGRVARRVADLSSVRFRRHAIELTLRLDESESGLTADFPLGLVLGAVTNLIDNSVYWLSASRVPDTAKKGRKILIATDARAFGGPAVIIADNGPGFADALEDASQPFFTRRPDGIGVGLYYVRLIMETIGGSLQMVDRESTPLGDEFTGAALALVFRRA